MSVVPTEKSYDFKINGKFRFTSDMIYIRLQEALGETL